MLILSIMLPSILLLLLCYYSSAYITRRSNALSRVFAALKSQEEQIPVTYICRICKNRFNEENRKSNCRYHRGRFIGAEMSKHLGSRSGGSNKGLVTFWDCCDGEEESSAGCVFGDHISYDEDYTNSFMLNRK